jgi:hypothetical protein
MAEFTVLTPYPHTPIRAQLEQQGRILHNDWARYTAGEVVFRPARMSVAALERMYEYAWTTFYRDYSTEVKMARLLMRVIEKEQADGTHRVVRPARRRGWHNPASAA